VEVDVEGAAISWCADGNPSAIFSTAPCAVSSLARTSRTNGCCTHG
jgi:hypothetical protein